MADGKRAMPGRRVPDGEWLTLAIAGRVAPGDYGKVPYTNAPADWFVCCPDGSIVRLWVNDDDQNGNRHVVTEHEDGTISVEGSILGWREKAGGVGSQGDQAWHGHLEHGDWRPV